MDSKKSNIEPIDITPEPVTEYEARFIVWKTDKIEMMDFEGTSDIFCRAFFDPEEDHLTDTHWRCQDGEGSFNWRMLMKMKSRQDAYNLQLQAWDKDIIASNDLIGEFSLDVAPLFEDCHRLKKIKTFCKQYWDDYMKEELTKRGYEHVKDIEWEEEQKFWVPVRRFVKDEKTGKEDLQFAGKILCSFQIFPMELAEKSPQGVGRSEPNNDPVCPEPEGRIKFSLNPFEMFNQLVGPAIRRKIYMALCCLACAALCAFMAPMVISNGFSKLIFG